MGNLVFAAVAAHNPAVAVIFCNFSDFCNFWGKKYAVVLLDSCKHYNIILSLTIKGHEMAEDTKILQIRLRDRTLSQVDRLMSIVQAPSRSDAVRRAMDITDTLLNAVLKGETIIIENPNGRQRQILITGLNT
jgi:hypothetical protein